MIALGIVLLVLSMTIYGLLCYDESIRKVMCIKYLFGEPTVLYASSFVSKLLEYDIQDSSLTCFHSIIILFSPLQLKGSLS
jgi:hypothetical protein